MQSFEINVGRRYGMRLKVALGEPLIEVNVIEKVGRKGHIKIQHLGGETAIALNDSRMTRIPFRLSTKNPQAERISGLSP